MSWLSFVSNENLNKSTSKQSQIIYSSEVLQSFVAIRSGAWQAQPATWCSTVPWLLLFRICREHHSKSLQLHVRNNPSCKGIAGSLPHVTGTKDWFSLFVSRHHLVIQLNHKICSSEDSVGDTFLGYKDKAKKRLKQIATTTNAQHRAKIARLSLTTPWACLPFHHSLNLTWKN